MRWNKTTFLGIMAIFESTFCPNSSSSAREWMSAVLALCSVHCCCHYWNLFILVIASQEVKFKLSQDFWTSDTELGLGVDSVACLRIGNEDNEFISNIDISLAIVLVKLSLGTPVVSVMCEIAVSSKATVTFQFGHVIRTDIIECCSLLWMFLKFKSVGNLVYRPADWGRVLTFRIKTYLLE